MPHRKIQANQSYTFVYYLLAVITIGTLGYSYIEGWSFFDAFYMTIITISTTGYQEVHDLSEPGRVFTVTLIFFGVGVFTFGLKQLIENQSLLDRKELRRRKMKKTIRQLTGHTIICGFGRMGDTICTDLERSGQSFVVIENDPEKMDELKSRGYLFISGDASDDHELIEANIEVAKAMVICINSDADTLYTLVAAKNINPDIFTICRSNNELARFRLSRIGADKIVQPITVTGREVARDIILATNNVPYHTADLSFCSDYNTYILEYPILDDSELLGASKTELIEAMHKQSFITIGILNQNDEFTFIAKFNNNLKAGDKIVGASDISDEV